MIYISQLIYIKDGEMAAFNEFERFAIPLIKKYNGELLFRLKPDENAFIELNIDQPDEIHLVSFKTEEDFQCFMKDEERTRFLHLKEQSIQSAVLFQGKKL